MFLIINNLESLLLGISLEFEIGAALKILFRLSIMTNKYRYVSSKHIACTCPMKPNSYEKFLDNCGAKINGASFSHLHGGPYHEFNE